jgi:hypothetical protein
VQPQLQQKSNKYYRIWVLCSLRYPACNAHAPYCHLWLVHLYNIFPHDLINSTVFWKKVIEPGVFFFIFPYSFCSHPLCLSDFNETWIFWADFQKKCSNIKFYENLSSGSWLVPCRWTDTTKLIVPLQINEHTKNLSAEEECILKYFLNVTLNFAMSFLRIVSPFGKPLNSLIPAPNAILMT